VERQGVSRHPRAVGPSELVIDIAAARRSRQVDREGDRRTGPKKLKKSNTEENI